MWKFWKKPKAIVLPDAPDWVKNYVEQTQNIDTKTPSREIDFVVIDLESTGLNIHKDRIISFASIPLFDFELLPGQSFHCYVNQSYFDTETVPIHGLLPRDIKNGLSEKEFIETIIPLLSGKVLVGHHTGYDIAMINQALHRYYDIELINPFVDTGDLYKKTFPSKFTYNRYPHQIPSLDEIAQEFEIMTHNRHSAMGDATITAFIFMKMWKGAEKGKKTRLKNLL